MRMSARTPSGGSTPDARASAAVSVETRTGRACHTTSFASRSAAPRLLLAHEAVEVDSRVLAAEVEGDGRGLRHVHEGFRQQVLPVVLLHVVAAPVGVDPALHAFRGERTVEDVEHVGPVLDHRQHARVAERAGVPGLPAALGVEGRAVEHDGRPAVVLAPRQHDGVELQQVRILPVQPLGHAVSERTSRPGAGRRSGWSA